jgi:hypothetical protein
MAKNKLKLTTKKGGMSKTSKAPVSKGKPRTSIGGKAHLR